MTKQQQIEKTVNVAKLKKAAKKIEEAIKLIEEVGKTQMSGDCNYFRHELETILSSDDGEAGFNAYIKIVEKK